MTETVILDGMYTDHPVYRLGLKQLTSSEREDSHSLDSQQKYLFISRIKRTMSDFVWVGNRNIIVIPNKVEEAGEISIRHYISGVEYCEELDWPSQKRDILCEVNEVQLDILKELLENLNKLQEKNVKKRNDTEFLCGSDEYKYFQDFFTFLVNHFNIKM